MWNTLKLSKPYLTKQQYRTIKGQIKAGDTEGARKGLIKLLNRNKNQNPLNN